MRTTATSLLSTLDHIADVIGAQTGATIAALTWDSTAQSITTRITIVAIISIVIGVMKMIGMVITTITGITSTNITTTIRAYIATSKMPPAPVEMHRRVLE
jgi:hypothetical protein